MDAYKIDLLSPKLEGETFEYRIGDAFFSSIDGLLQRGDIYTKVKCISAGTIFKFQIQSIGYVVVPCDRCLSDLELRIETTDVLSVKLGEEYADDGDCVIVSEAEGYLDLAQFIYEFIVLSMPMAHCHEPGKCDDAMMLELSRRQSTRSGTEDDECADSEGSGAFDLLAGEDSVEPVDSRWAVLKTLKDNNKKQKKMAHPKRRQSKTRTRKRRTHDVAVAPTLAVCPNCGEFYVYHTVCSACGYYRGKVAIVKETAI